MGACISSTFKESGSSSATAKVLSISGALTEYNVPVLVSEVLEAEINSSSLSKNGSYFVCNSESLSYDDYIPAMDQNDTLQTNQLYFVLPKSKLQRKLVASDMAALAVKASVGLQNASKGDSHRRKKARVSPVLLVNQTTTTSFYPDSEYHQNSEYHQKTTSFYPDSNQKSMSKTTSSVRRLHKSTSRRAKLAVRSFRLKLGTIYEGTELF